MLVTPVIAHMGLTIDTRVAVVSTNIISKSSPPSMTTTVLQSYDISSIIVKCWSLQWLWTWAIFLSLTPGFLPLWLIDHHIAINWSSLSSRFSSKRDQSTTNSCFPLWIPQLFLPSSLHWIHKRHHYVLFIIICITAVHYITINITIMFTNVLIIFKYRCYMKFFNIPGHCRDTIGQLWL